MEMVSIFGAVLLYSPSIQLHQSKNRVLRNDYGSGGSKLGIKEIEIE
jgi:hypothetical protein